MICSEISPASGHFHCTTCGLIRRVTVTDFLKCVDLMCSSPASLFSSLQVSATMVSMPSVKLSNCALSFEVGERILCIGLCSQFLLNKTKQA